MNSEAPGSGRLPSLTRQDERFLRMLAIKPEAMPSVMPPLATDDEVEELRAKYQRGRQPPDWQMETLRAFAELDAVRVDAARNRRAFIIASGIAAWLAPAALYGVLKFFEVL